MRICSSCGNTYPDDANFCPMDAERLPPPAAEGGSVDRTIAEPALVGGRFKPTPPPRTTPTGLSWRATDSESPGEVSLLMVESRAVPSPMVADRALRELKQIGKLKSDRVLRVIAEGRLPEGQLFVATELPAAPTLEELIAAEGALPLARARAILLDVGEALLEAQKVGVIHRDLSPRNILVGERAQVSGFGLAEPVDERVFGAPAFLSPEQAEGKPVDQRSNIYSLGALLYYMVVGEPPFAGDSQAQVRQHLHAQPAAPSQKKPDLPADLDKVVLKALEKSGGRRHLTLRQLLNEIESISAEKSVAPPPAAVAPSSSARPEAGGSARTLFGMEAAMRSAAAGAPGAPGVSDRSDKPEPSNPSDRRAEMDATDPTLQPVSAAAVEPAARRAAALTSDAGAATIVEMQAPPEVLRAAAEMAARAQANRPAPVEPAPAPAPARVAPPVIAPTPGVAPAARAPQPPAPQAAPARPAPSSNPPGGKGKKGFRETAWFKRGEIEEELARQAAAVAEQDPLAGPAHTEAVVDDASLTADDRARLSLKTGRTETMASVKPSALPGDHMSEHDMIAEMGTSRRLMVFGGAAIGAIAILVAVYFLFLR